MVNAHLQGAWQASCVVMSYEKRLYNKFVLLKTQGLFRVDRKHVPSLTV